MEIFQLSVSISILFFFWGVCGALKNPNMPSMPPALRNKNEQGMAFEHLCLNFNCKHLGWCAHS